MQQWTPIDAAADLLLRQLREQIEALRARRDAGELSDEDFGMGYESLRQIAHGLTKEGINPLPPLDAGPSDGEMQTS